MIKNIAIVLVLVFAVPSCFAQSWFSAKSAQNIERKKNKVDTLYTTQERANLQLWFYEEVQNMNLAPDVEDAYYRYVLKYTFDMTRLDDADKDYTSTERKKELDRIVESMNSSVKKVLSESNYAKHEEIFTKILKSVYRRSGWEWDKD